MKQLLFHIGADRYGMRLCDVRRVLPLAQLKQLPLAPAYVAGVLDFHGQPVPVIDLSLLAGVAPGRDHFDTRILLIDYRAPDGASHPLGLLAERVLGVSDIATAALADSGVRGAPFLGQVAGGADGMVQLVEPDQLLSAEVRAILFQPEAGAA